MHPVRAGLVMGALGCCLCCPVFVASGHPGVHHRIDEISLEISTSAAPGPLYLERAQLYRQDQQWKPAERDLALATEHDPRIVDLDLAWATLLAETERPSRALDHLDRFLRVQPDHLAARSLRAEVRASVGFYASAITDLDWVIHTASPPLPDHFEHRARLWMLLGDPQQALEGLDDGLQRLGSVPVLKELAIEVCVLSGHLPEAIARQERSVAANPRPAALLRLGNLHHQSGDLQAASKAYHRAQQALISLSATRRNAPANKRLASELRAGLAVVTQEDH